MPESDEIHRLDVLAAYDVLESGPELEFDELANLAGTLLAAPIAFLCLVGSDRLWFKAHSGSTLTEAPRANSFCSMAITSDATLVVTDARQDQRFCNSGLVTDAPCVRFYVGSPLISPSGARLGTLCVIDDKPREAPAEALVSALAALARLAVIALEHRKTRLSLAKATARAERLQALHTLFAGAKSCQDLLSATLTNLCELHGATAGCLYQYDPTGSVIATLSQVGPAASAHLSAEGLRAADMFDPMTAAVARLVNAGATASGVVKPAVFTGIVLPVLVPDSRFAICLALAAPGGDTRAIEEDVRCVAPIIRPHLERLVLEQQDSLLTQALDCAADGVLITLADCDQPGPSIVYANASMTRISGYATQELLGKTPRLLQGAASDRQTLDLVRESLMKRNPVRFEIDNYHKDGHRFRSEIDITPVFDDTGKHTHFISIQRDISQRRKEEEANDTRERLNRSLFDHTPMAMWIADPDSHRFLEVNDAAIAQYGWSREQFLGMTLLDIRSPAEQQIFLEARRGKFYAEINGRVWEHFKADGSKIFVRASTHLIAYQGHNARMTVVWDVTMIELSNQRQIASHRETIDLAAKLKQQTDELIDIQRLAHLGTWRHLTGGSDLYWSAEMFKIMGHLEPGFRPTSASAIACIHPEDREFALITFERVLNTGSLEVIELRVVRPDHSVIHTRWNARQYCDEAGVVVGVYGYCQDITESKQAEDTLHRSEKLKSLGQLTGGIAHDFNNLLTVVTLNLEDVIDTLPEADPCQPMLHAALQAGERGAELTAQLLSYSRRAILRPLPTNIPSFLESLKPLLIRSLGKHHQLEITIANEAAKMVVDPAQLDSALLNLVTNARDSMPGGGLIQLTVSRDTFGEGGGGQSEGVSAGRYVVISVIDTGTGIAPDQLDHVFEPFFTTKDVGHGSGLGLSMVYGFAKQSGGHVILESVLNQGTTARLYLPLHKDEPDLDVKAWNAAPGMAVKGLRVLLVEDQLTVLYAVTRVLESIGLEVVKAASAAEALEALATNAPFDLLFTDIMLPGGENGLFVAKYAREIAPSIKILLTTGFTEHRIDEADMTWVDAEFLMKPYKRVALFETLQNLFPDRRIYHAPADSFSKDTILIAQSLNL